MRRRTWLQAGVAGAVLLAVGGVATQWAEPALRGGQLTEAGRGVLRPIGQAVLEGTLPPGGEPAARALDAWLVRMDALLAALPRATQDEVGTLLTLLGTTAGRQALAGLQPPWPQASTAQVQAALQSMRTSSLALRRQAYLALHDLAGAAYFTDPATWAQIGYPGPMEV